MRWMEFTAVACCMLLSLQEVILLPSYSF